MPYYKLWSEYNTEGVYATVFRTEEVKSAAKNAPDRLGAAAVYNGLRWVEQNNLRIIMTTDAMQRYAAMGFVYAEESQPKTSLDMRDPAAKSVTLPGFAAMACRLTVASRVLAGWHDQRVQMVHTALLDWMCGQWVGRPKMRTWDALVLASASEADLINKLNAKSF